MLLWDLPGICRVGDVAGCPIGSHCVGAEFGEWGRCEKDPPECHVGDESCQEGYVCVGIQSTTNGAPGACQPLPECTPRHFLCGLVCCDEMTERCSNQGQCELLGPCERKPNGFPCDDGEGVCKMGECLPKPPPDECAEQQDGATCDNDNGVCEWGDCVPRLRDFHILLTQQRAVVPLRADGAVANDPHADWVGPGSAQMHVTAKGPGAGTDLYVQTYLGLLDPSACDVHCLGSSCEWTCTLPAGWAGPLSETVVEVGIGTQTAQLWTYKVSLEPPRIVFNVPQTAALGDILRVCVAVTTLDAPLSYSDASMELWNNTVLLPLNWIESSKSETGATTEKCWIAQLPLTLAWAGTGPLSTQLHVDAQAVDTVGRATTEVYDGTLTLTRLACDTVISSAVTTPLVFVGERLAFAAGTNLYFFEPDICAVTAGSPLVAGTMRTPMVALGDGSLAVATASNAGPAEKRNRLFTVDAATQYPEFVDSECVIGTSAGTAATAQFDKGLSLLSLSPARLAAPANADSNTVLVAYTPSEANEADRCIGSASMNAVALTTAQSTTSSEVLAVYDSSLSTWRFNGSAWTPGSWSSVHTLPTGTLTGVGLNGGNIWLSGHPAASQPFLQLWQNGATSPTTLPISTTIVTPTGSSTYTASYVGPAAVDSQDRAYMVSYGPLAGSGSSYVLLRLNANGTGIVGTAFPTGSTGDIVGSPLLGNPLPGSNPEVYVVRGNGRVVAFDAETLAQLWMTELGFHVPVVAQPVLVGNTLWVVGTQGQVRGIRVASDGLSRTAKWPKAFHDNCNTSSDFITPTNMPVCFE
ncbi:MAG: hypothetical protein FWD46_03690 [Cystobacterineae bacterium]|nr:hypothetical protein [Cystobacterineae bacterium]